MDRVTIWRGCFKTPFCDSHHSKDFATQEEAEAYGLSAESAGIIDISPVEAEAPEARRRRISEEQRIRRTTCLLPPAEDLLALHAAKQTPPELWETIDPSAGVWKETRRRLDLIRNEKYNQALASTP